MFNMIKSRKPQARKRPGQRYMDELRETQNYTCIGVRNHTCPLNGRPFTKEHSCEYDHIIEFAISHDNSNGNYQAICPSCHRGKTTDFQIWWNKLTNLLKNNIIDEYKNTGKLLDYYDKVIMTQHNSKINIKNLKDAKEIERIQKEEYEQKQVEEVEETYYWFSFIILQHYYKHLKTPEDKSLEELTEDESIIVNNHLYINLKDYYNSIFNGGVKFEYLSDNDINTLYFTYYINQNII